MRSTNLISPRMELNQYHLLTKKVLFRLSYRGLWCVAHNGSSDLFFRFDYEVCAWCAFYAGCVYAVSVFGAVRLP